MSIIQRSVVFTKPQYAFIQKEGKRLGVSFAEVIRRIIDQHREEKKAESGIHRSLSREEP